MQYSYDDYTMVECIPINQILIDPTIDIGTSEMSDIITTSAITSQAWQEAIKNVNESKALGARTQWTVGYNEFHNEIAISIIIKDDLVLRRFPYIHKNRKVVTEEIAKFFVNIFFPEKIIYLEITFP